MNYKKYLALFFIMILVIVMIFIIHNINNDSFDESIYKDYSKELEVLYDEASMLDYGNLENYNKIDNELNTIKYNLDETLKTIKKNYIVDELNPSDYFKIKGIYKSNLKQIDIVKNTLKTKIN